MNPILEFIDEYRVFIILILIAMVSYLFLFKKSKFTESLVSTKLNTSQPLSFSPIMEAHGTFPPLANPVVPEEIGLSQVYPQGSGVGMDRNDSNTFDKGRSGVLLTDYTIPESYGESSLTDPTGALGANQGARILRINNNGDSLKYKPYDETNYKNYSAAYNDAEVQMGYSLINDTKEIDYSDKFIPSNNLVIQTSPGQVSNLDNCEKMYPGVVKYNDFCITRGDIPYGKEVNGNVNPRLVSRWESFTGNYSRSDALKPIDGVLYPSLMS
jgi:hypothetical protein